MKQNSNFHQFHDTKPSGHNNDSGEQGEIPKDSALGSSHTPDETMGRDDMTRWRKE